MNEPGAEGARPQWHSYRCPVCGHTDEVDFAAGPESRVACSHCGTDLDLVARSPDAASAAVKVATRRRRGR
jgi:hypothetical protein